MNVTIVGGTGTLGTELVRQLSEKKNSHIRIISRDELKQKQLKDRFPHVECFLGDIKDCASLVRPFYEADLIFHVAALKHIDILEDNPEESIKTNVIGTMNVIDVARSARAKRLIFSSTDKAVHPINVYGMCKGISERLMLNEGHTVYRWGNVLNSRGSAISYFVDSIKSGRAVNLTHPDMSRFWIKIEDAVSFMLETAKDGKGVMIPRMKAAPVIDVIETIGEIVGKVPNISISGMRKGEKIHESITAELTSENAPQYTRAELKNLLKAFCV